jgi:exonuclease SbcC
MIFTKFFKAKWQHKDSNVRLTAINTELDPSSPEQNAILLQLAEQDSNELVRRAALIKLNSFARWLSASHENSNVQVKQFAQKQVQDIVQGQHKITLSQSAKMAYLAEQSISATLESWLQHETQSEIIIALFEKLNKPHLLPLLFSQKPDQSVQEYLVKQTEQVSTLEKLLKKSTHDTISAQITSKLAMIGEQTEKPVKLRKQLQLNLSKLLALKDIADYAVFLAKKEQLLSQWQLLQSGMDCLDDSERASFSDKKQGIEQQLDKLFIKKQEAYAQQQIAVQLERQKTQAKDSFEKLYQVLNQRLLHALSTEGEVDQQSLEENLRKFNDDVNASLLNLDEQASYGKRIGKLQHKLTQLPVITQSIQDAQALLTQFDEITLPSQGNELNQAQTHFDDWSHQWRKIAKITEGFMPESVNLAYKDKTAHWRQGVQPLVEEQNRQGKFVQKKLPELKRLLDSGKYNACFGLFKRINAVYSLLSLSQQQRLQRDFDLVSKKVAELSDWEHYIATPRKQQLLSEVTDLIANPIDNPNELAAKVKQYRKTWMSLGHADDDIDQTLNQEFNHACEQAFAPCRLFYAEQEKLREQHLAKRVQIIDLSKALAEKLTDAELDFKWLDGQVNKLTQQWQQAGEVERGKYQALRQDYSQALQPVKAAIRNFHERNSESKNALMIKAKLELDNSDIYAAIEAVKTLQSKWREIGYAGPREENKLWQSFRAVNDQLFKKRDAMKQQQVSLQSAQLIDFQQNVDTIKQDLVGDSDKSLLQAARLNATNLLEQVMQNKPHNKSIANVIETLIGDLEQQLKQIDSDNERKHWQDLFSLLLAMANGELDQQDLSQRNDFANLSSFWQKKLNEQSSYVQQTDRADKTLELEILAGIDSPAELAPLRMQVQVNLMQEKMSSGNETNLQQRFIDWLQLGQLNQQDIALLARIKPIFCL